MGAASKPEDTAALLQHQATSNQALGGLRRSFISVDIPKLEASLATLLRRGLIPIELVRNTSNQAGAVAEYYETIVAACEVVVARGGNRDRISRVLQRIATSDVRRRDRLSISEGALIDVTLRAQALLERLAGRKLTLESYLVDPPAPSAELPPEEAEKLARAETEKKDELQRFVGPLIELYDARAQAVIGALDPDTANTLLSNAAAGYKSKEYQYPRQYWAVAMRTHVALSIARLMAVPGLSRAALLTLSGSILNTQAESLGEAEAEVLRAFGIEQSLHQQIIAVATTRAAAIRALRVSAEDKINALVRLARLLAPISPGDANSLFNEAIEVAGEVDADTVHEIQLFTPLVRHAASTMSARDRRLLAGDLAIIVEDAGIRLAGQDGFPWSSASEALTILDPAVALAATARWEDSDLVGRHWVLPKLLETALSNGQMSPIRVASFAPLLNELSSEFSVRLLETARQRGEHHWLLLAETLAKWELTRFGRGEQSELSDYLSAQGIDKNPSFWVGRLRLATAYHRAVGAKQEPDARTVGGNLDAAEAMRQEMLASIDWTRYRLVAPEAIADVILKTVASARAINSYVFSEQVLDRMREAISPRDRAAHLEALSQVTSLSIHDYEIAQAIARGVEAWHDSPSVRDWCQARLLQVIVDRLPGFSRYIVHGQSPLPALLEILPVPHDAISATLVEALERHVDALNAATIYTLVGIVGQYCSTQDAGQVASRYARRLVQRIPLIEREKWNLADIPSSNAAAVARFLYALMGDIDHRIRWRAAHALRCMAKFEDSELLAELVGLYEHTSEQSFRAPQTPFYWLAARLWLLIGLDRIAAETPSILRPYGQWLIGVATNAEFPHIVVRSLAKSAVLKMIESNVIDMTAEQRRALRRANISHLKRKIPRKSRDEDFGRYTYEQNKGRRFHFDSMDTLPYWYSRALGTFADVTQEEFLDVAEQWIVDRWHVTNNPWKWDDEPRQGRFSDQSYGLMGHDHGGRVTLERFSTHLEWHAMWCAAGELMQTRALARRQGGEYDSLEQWLKGETPTMPPYWLADLQGMKPLEHRLWFSPTYDVDDWVERVRDDDFLEELFPSGNDEVVIVGGTHETRSQHHLLSARIESALVSPGTAGALARAMQTVNRPYSYRIPAAGDDLEINHAPYKLLGWLSDSQSRLGIDEQDPLRYEIEATKRAPSNETMAKLNLVSIYDDEIWWVDTKNRRPAFTYEAWGDSRGDELERHRQFDTSVRSGGWRLRADKVYLKSLLAMSGLDMIVEVELKRQNWGYYEYSRRSEEKNKEARFNRIFVLRRDGSIETAEGRIGTWALPRS